MKMLFLLGFLFIIKVVDGCHFSTIRIYNGTFIIPDSSAKLRLWHTPCGGGSQHSNDSHYSPGEVSLTPRPWVVKIQVLQDEKVVQHCSGSVLNHRWIITAAHCICNSFYGCDTKSTKTFSDPDHRIRLQFVNNATRSVSKVVVHQLYEKQILNSTTTYMNDVALIETTEPIAIKDHTDQHGNPQAICLPPKPSLAEANSPPPGQPHRKFEDLDCTLKDPDDITKEPDHGNLNCHPGFIADPFDLNYMSRSSYVSSFGEIGQPPNSKRYCRTNQYGPKNSFNRCAGKCYPNTERKINIGGTTVKIANPSLGDVLCNQYFHDNSSQRMAQDFQTEINNYGVNTKEDYTKNYSPAKVILRQQLSSNNTIEHACYPFADKEAAQAVHMGNEIPYYYGWCRVCSDVKSQEDCRYEDTDGNPYIPFDKQNKLTDWGWCLPECSAPDESIYKPKEFQVNTFICKTRSNSNIDICVASRTKTPYTLTYEVMGVSDIDRSFKLVTGDIPGYSMKNNEKSTHNQFSDDLCTGDEGAGVWKSWKFDEGDSPAPETKAILVSILSRPQGQCIDLDNGNPTPSYVHEDYTQAARVSELTPWILANIQSGRNENRDDDFP